MELASKGAGTVGLAEASLRDYLAATQAQLTARTEFVRADAEQLVSEATDRELLDMYRKEAGMTVRNDSAELIRSLATKRREMRDKREKELAKVTAANSFDASGLARVPQEKLDAAKKSFAVLSEELSSGEWIALVGGYVKVISAGVDQLASPTDDKPKDDTP
ncbi:hypothetical protein [Steroidobacter sp.]|uniref:hypothetical protein n=1 Tax=Steroidobacter sp. TaxID=1978227 RepID=UPI001A579DEE|nr:hypothetical protein [Steroidobacter sp.]MBL8265666.1 hypothetical protein [Steroidobacter sp.]